MLCSIASNCFIFSFSAVQYIAVHLTAVKCTAMYLVFDDCFKFWLLRVISLGHVNLPLMQCAIKP